MRRVTRVCAGGVSSVRYQCRARGTGRRLKASRAGAAGHGVLWDDVSVKCVTGEQRK